MSRLSAESGITTSGRIPLAATFLMASRIAYEGPLSHDTEVEKKRTFARSRTAGNTFSISLLFQCVVHGRDHVLDVLSRQFGAQRQRKCSLSNPLRVREIALAEPECFSIVGMQMNRSVMNAAPDFLPRQRIQHLVARFPTLFFVYLNRKKVPRVPRVAFVWRRKMNSQAA